jgi:hypothetical protein
VKRSQQGSRVTVVAKSSGLSEKRATLNSSTPTTFCFDPNFSLQWLRKNSSTRSFGRLAEINALVTPLEKPSPPGDKAKNPVFSSRY